MVAALGWSPGRRRIFGFRYFRGRPGWGEGSLVCVYRMALELCGARVWFGFRRGRGAPRGRLAPTAFGWAWRLVIGYRANGGHARAASVGMGFITSTVGGVLFFTHGRLPPVARTNAHGSGLCRPSWSAGRVGLSVATIGLWQP